MTCPLTGRARLTWHVGPTLMRRGTQGHVAERARPTRCAGSACGVDTWQEATRMPVRGATWQGGWRVKGPRVSGPWLEYWGGNPIALNSPPI